MGGKTSKCTTCLFPWKRKCRISPMPPERVNVRTDQSSREILQDLFAVGFFTTAEKPGGVQLVMRNENFKPEKMVPRRLPSLSKNVKPIEGKFIYDREEKNIMVEIRRMEFLKEKGKMARLHDDRRMAVLGRKRGKLLEKVAKTEAKLRKGLPKTPKTSTQRKPVQGDKERAISTVT